MEKGSGDLRARGRQAKLPTSKKKLKNSLRLHMVMDAFNLRIQRNESDRSLSFKPSWYTN